jgi:hypothetical protein
MHNEHGPSRRERLAYFDQDEVTLVRLVLAADPDFQAKARVVSESAPSERLAAAEREAEGYALYETPKRRAMAKELLLMADCLLAERPWRPRGLKAAVFLYANSHRKTVWADHPSLDDLGARRVRPRWDPSRPAAESSLRQGAESLAWFGAGRCIGCGTAIADKYELGWSNRHSRRKHCDACCIDDDLNAATSGSSSAGAARRTCDKLSMC